MSKIDEWIKRVRAMNRGKTLEEVRAFDKNVVMTTTQAWRFRELQAGEMPPRPDAPADAAEKAWYSIEEACARLGSSEDELLADAAEGRIGCYIDATRLRGSWAPGQAPPPAAAVKLAVRASDCRTIGELGSANVGELEFRGESPPLVFRLAEPQWIDRKALRFAHPRPSRPDAGR